MECKNCGHEIKKRYFEKQGQSMWMWVHKDGGNYCKVSVYGKNLPFGKVCFCSNVEPKIEVRKCQKEVRVR